MFELPILPYPMDALTPHISVEAVQYHYGKHHKGYVDQLNAQVRGTGFEHATLEEIIRTARGPLFANAAQVWNHSFYWDSLAPEAGGRPSGELLAAIEAAFGSFEVFVTRFTEVALNIFGSGWAWLVQNEGDLDVMCTCNAGTPVQTGGTPLLTCDVWEHAYYIDYRNARAEYVKRFWNLVNWNTVARRLERVPVALSLHA